MGRIGRTYPRAEAKSIACEQRNVSAAYHHGRKIALRRKATAGAIGLVLALGLIGWLLTL